MNRGAYDLRNAGLSRLKKKLIKSMKEKEERKPRSLYQPAKIPSYVIVE